jgi:hypothetical protein
MLDIRPEQMAAFSRAASEDFERRAVGHFRATLSQIAADFSDEELKRRLRDCAARAANYGLVMEREALLFADVSLILEDERFEESLDHPWALDILRNHAWPPSVKAERLLEMACSQRDEAIDIEVGDDHEVEVESGAGDGARDE